MAVTKIGAIKTSLAVAIDYILNPEKTDNGRLVHTFGCTADGKTAEREFLDIRALGTGKGSVLAQHIKQSFKIGEITPEQALEIGVKTAERLLDITINILYLHILIKLIYIIILSLIILIL